MGEDRCPGKVVAKQLGMDDEQPTLLEVGVVEWHGQIAIVHAMRARPRFLR